MQSAGWTSRTTEYAPVIDRLGADPASPFPDPELALGDPDGLLAWGGDLRPQRLLNAYARGVFPWYAEGQPILWWCPSRRCVVFPDNVHVSRRLQRVLRQGRFHITIDQAFGQVVAGCAQPRPGRESTWITPEMKRAYSRLHLMGHAHSMETWIDGQLVGGIYGLAVGRVFCGESMFSSVSDASKVALVSLCQHLALKGFALLDCQICNPHLVRMGAVEIGRSEFLNLLSEHGGPILGAFEPAGDGVV